MKKSLEQIVTDVFSEEEVSKGISSFVAQNLNPKFVLRPYQKEAFYRLDYFLKNINNIQNSKHILFQMATGSGKTLIMAGTILALYEQGYRNFIFFVNSQNIIDKTRDNFLNHNSFKYLFNNHIQFDNNQIVIKEVGDFETTNKNDINILFSTIQSLHSQLKNPRENAVTYAGIDTKKIVLLSDEAHHINVDTKKNKLSKKQSQNLENWEKTVNNILNKNTENLLIEFTATASFENLEIKKKYIDKLIYNYPLRQFRIDKYSKEVKILQSNLALFERTLQALLLSQYRKKLFEKHHLLIKPVLMLKSRTIVDSESFYKSFIDDLNTLNIESLLKIRSGVKQNSFIEKAFIFFDKNGISLENLILELQEDFSVERCLIINSKNESIEKQLIVNSLEDENNGFRVVFAVDKLNEGWDVLNLFDIVRLYDIAINGNESINKTTISEAQLIGRGARYCPFQLNSSQAFYQRKYDNELENELRVCEELYYHSKHNPNYIIELNQELVKIGLLQDTNKKEFKTRIGNFRPKSKKTLSSFLDKKIQNKLFKVVLLSEQSVEKFLFGIEMESKSEIIKKTIYLKDIDLHIRRKALNKLPFYKFDNLRKCFPELRSVSEFLMSENYSLNLKVEVEGSFSIINKLSNDLLLKLLLSVYNDVSVMIKESQQFNSIT